MNTRSISLSKPLIAVACVLPLVLLIALSFSRNWVFPQVFPRQFTRENWEDAFRPASGIGQSLLLTVMLATGVALLSTAAGFYASRLVAYHRHRARLLLLAYLPFVLSPVILALCLKFYFIRLGWAGTFWGVLVAQLIIAFPYATIFFVGFWNRRLQDLERVAFTLGASPAERFRRVVLPIAGPSVLICFFQCFLIAWFEYGLTSVIGYGKVQTLTIRVYQFVTEANMFFAALCCCLLVLPPVLLLWINKRIIFRQTD